MRARIGREGDSRSDHGASAVEYGLLIAAIAVTIAAAVFALGNVVGNTLNTSKNCLTDASTGAGFARCPSTP